MRFGFVDVYSSGSSMSISVVVPHKDCPEKARRLLMSIPSYVNVVVVDDNSEEYNLIKLEAIVADGFDNVSLIKNPSKESNAGTARNAGIDFCRRDSDWIIFADSDDEFRLENFILLEQLLNNDLTSDVVFFDCVAKKEIDGSSSSRCDNYRSLISSWPETKSTIAACWPVPWGKAIRSKVIFDPSGPRFESRCAGNDMEFSARLAALKPKVSVFPKVVYVCHESDSSLTATLTPGKALDRLKANIRCNEIFLANKVSKPHFNYCLRFLFVSLSLIIRDKEFSVLADFARNFSRALIANMRSR